MTFCEEFELFTSRDLFKVYVNKLEAACTQKKNRTKNKPVGNTNESVTLKNKYMNVYLCM